MAHCDHCGTTWLARHFQENPYKRESLLARKAPTDVSEAIVIENVGPGFTRPINGRSRMPPPGSRREPPADRRWLKGVGAFFGVVAAVFVLRIPIVAALPQLSANGLPADVEKLEFQRVRSETVANGGVKTLMVEGEIINRSGKDIAVPAIRVSLHSPDGDEVYSWLVEPTAAGLAPGRTIGFRSAVASPPGDASQVTLKLAQRENQIVGLR